MDLGESLVVTLSATTAAAVAASAHLHKPLRGILGVYLRDDNLAAFWVAFAQVFAVLVPLVVELFAFALSPVPKEPDVVYVLGLLKWGLVGLVAAVGLVGVGVGLFGGFGASAVYVDPEQADDLNRLMERVRELRAREVVRKADADRRR